MPLYPTAGCKLSIGPVLSDKSSDFVLADFSALTPYVEITALDALGSVGDTSATITASIIGEQRDKVFKGTRSAGVMEVVSNIDNTDAGQLALIAAEKTPYSYAFKLELNDKPPAGASPKNSIRYFIAKVMSASEVFDQANNMMKLNTSLAINGNIVRVAASAT